MSWWFDPDEYDLLMDVVDNHSSNKSINRDAEVYSQNKFCFHEWKPIVLIISTVYNCSKCGVKREDCEGK